MVAGALRVSSSGLGRFFLQFGEDLFGFIIYWFLTVHISYLFHLCIRGDVQLRNAVLMCISSLIKPRFNLIYGRYLHQPHCGPVLNTISLHISPISVSMATYEFDKHSLLFTCLPNPFLIGSETKMIKSDLQLWRELFHKLRQCFRASFNHA